MRLSILLYNDLLSLFKISVTSMFYFFFYNLQILNIEKSIHCLEQRQFNINCYLIGGCFETSF